MQSKWRQCGLLALGVGMVVSIGCVRKPTLREVKQDPTYQRAAQAHQGLVRLSPPASCQGRSCREILAQEKQYTAVASRSYEALAKQDKKSLKSALARCELGAFYVARMKLLKRMPPPSKSLLRQEIVAKIKASFTKRGIAPGGQEQMLQKPKIKQGIERNIQQWSKKRQSDIASQARWSQLKARRHYKRCFEDAERHGELKEHRVRAKRFLDKQGT